MNVLQFGVIRKYYDSKGCLDLKFYNYRITSLDKDLLLE